MNPLSLGGAEDRDLARRVARAAQIIGKLLDFGELGQNIGAGFDRHHLRIGFFARHLRIGFTDGRDRIGGGDIVYFRRENRTGAGPRAGNDGNTNAAGARGAVMRRSSPVAIAPALSINVASVAISTIGSFFG